MTPAHADGFARGGRRAPSGPGRPLLVPGLLALTACAAPRRAEDVAELRRMHERVVRAHLEGDVSPWLALESERYVVASRGELTFPSKEERRAAREPYLARTRFSVYRDLCEPVIEVSDDGTLAWLVCQVEVRGVQQLEEGGEEPLEAVWAWIELYRREEEGWRMVGNVSNQRPPAR